MKNLDKEINEALVILNLNPDQEAYTKNLIKYFYALGDRAGFVQGREIYTKATNPEPEGINLAHELAGGLTNPSY